MSSVIDFRIGPQQQCRNGLTPSVAGSAAATSHLHSSLEHNVTFSILRDGGAKKPEGLHVVWLALLKSYISFTGR